MFNGITTSTNYLIQDGSFTEYVDGTARLLATFVNQSEPTISFDADVTFTGRTYDPPTGSPYTVTCNNTYVPDPTDWYYYPNFIGTLTGNGAIDGAILEIVEDSHAFQIGTGANLNEEFVYGSAAWLLYSVISEPNDPTITFNMDSRTDFNFGLSGGNLTCIDLELNKTADLLQVEDGDVVTYTISLANQGPGEAVNVSIEDVLPASVSYLSSSASVGSYDDVSGIWTVGNMADGALETLDVTVTVLDVSAPITNFAQVETANPDDIDSTPGNDTNGTPDEDDEDNVTIDSVPPPVVDLELTKTADVSTAANGDVVNFSLTVTNNGPDDATGVSVEDVVPGGLSYNSSSPSKGSYNDATGIWTIGSMANGASETIVINMTVMDISSPITNFAQVETADQDDVDSTPGNDSNGTPDEDDEDDVTIMPEGGEFADLELTKTSNVSEFGLFEHVFFTITVVNNGPQTAN